MDVEDSEARIPHRNRLFDSELGLIKPPDDKLPPHEYVQKYKPISQRPLERAHRVEVALGMAVASHVTPGVRQADRLIDSAILERHESRLQFLRQVQTLIDETDARITLRKIQEQDSWRQDDEEPLREAVDDWSEEIADKAPSFRFKYRTPKAHSARIDAMAEVLGEMRDCWLVVDLDLQARGFRPGKDKNQYDRERGLRHNLGAGDVHEAMRQALPELFGAESPQTRDARLRRDNPKTPTQKLNAKIDPWDELKLIMSKSIDRAASDVARQNRKFEGSSRKRRHGVD